MLDLFHKHPTLFKTLTVKKNEKLGISHFFQLSAYLYDDSRLEVNDNVYPDGRHKYSYQWMNPDNSLLRRWDNAPHWPDVTTYPHHVHVLDDKVVDASTIVDIEKLLDFLESSVNPT